LLLRRTFEGGESGAKQDKENPKDQHNNRYSDYCGDDVFRSFCFTSVSSMSLSVGTANSAMVCSD
jgi:hypothetical protein